MKSEGNMKGKMREVENLQPERKASPLSNSPKIQLHCLLPVHPAKGSFSVTVLGTLDQLAVPFSV